MKDDGNLNLNMECLSRFLNAVYLLTHKFKYLDPSIVSWMVKIRISQLNDPFRYMFVWTVQGTEKVLSVLLLINNGCQSNLASLDECGVPRLSS